MSQHLIHRQLLELSYSDSAQARSDLEKWRDWFHIQLLPEIESILDELDIPGKINRIERLEVNLGTFTGKLDWDSIRRKLKEELSNQLIPIRKEWNQTSPFYDPLRPTQPQDQNQDLQLLLVLLRYGRRPWWSSHSKKQTITGLITKLIKQKDQQFRSWLKTGGLSLVELNRLNYHLSLGEVRKLIFSVYPPTEQAVTDLFKSLRSVLIPAIISQEAWNKISKLWLTEAAFSKDQNLQNNFSSWLQKHIFETTLSRKQNEGATRDFLLKIGLELQSLGVSDREIFTFIVAWSKTDFARTQFPQATRIAASAQWESRLKNATLSGSVAISNPTKLQSKNPNLESSQLPLDETFPISNAGLILTAPFLPHFFKGIGLVNGKEIISKEHQRRGALLIQYMIFRETEFEEADLLLNKLLCGLPWTEPIPIRFVPTMEEQEEINNLLQTMASRWTALKSTNGASLASSFFPREGSLRRVEKGYELHIPRLSIDILLNRLPWTVSVIKLPWMTETLFTEW